jgi:hypothetical protein
VFATHQGITAIIIVVNKTYTHHAEGLVDPKVLAKKPVTDFGYP